MNELIVITKNVCFDKGKKETILNYELYQREGNLRTITQLNMYQHGKQKIASKTITLVGLMDDFYQTGEREDILWEDGEQFCTMLLELSKGAKERYRDIVGSSSIETFYL